MCVDQGLNWCLTVGFVQGELSKNGKFVPGGVVNQGALRLVLIQVEESLFEATSQSDAAEYSFQSNGELMFKGNDGR